MPRSRDELLRAAQKIGIMYRIPPTEEAETIWARIRDAFFPTEDISSLTRHYFLWEHLENSNSIRTASGWQLVGEFIGPQPLFVFFNPADDQTIIEFSSGQDLTAVLTESFLLEFYATDGASYLLCFNHHDYLIGAGAAAGWIERIIAP
jgi:hypothetical protein